MQVEADVHLPSVAAVLRRDQGIPRVKEALSTKLRCEIADAAGHRPHTSISPGFVTFPIPDF